MRRPSSGGGACGWAHDLLARSQEAPEKPSPLVLHVEARGVVSPTSVQKCNGKPGRFSAQEEGNPVSLLTKGVPMNRFDEVAKALAGAQTRRQALGRLGGGLAAGVLAALGLKEAWGDSPSSGCQDHCGAFFPPPRGKGTKNAYGQCVSGCESCVHAGGSACGSLPNCCFDSEVCCGDGNCCAAEDCCGGACLTPCPNGQTRDPTTCACVSASPCSNPAACPNGGSCGPATSGCGCFTTTEGDNFCGQDIPCPLTIACTTSADCPTGWACAVTTCCGTQSVCESPCGDPPAGDAPAADVPSTVG
jgi:hypothetical protein